MSWSANCTVPKGAFKSEVPGTSQGQQIIDSMRATGNDNCAVERDRALATARGTVIQTLMNGVLGNPEEHAYQVNISGHANPENQAAPGWANDCLNIQIHQTE
jgi:hypothetical protein